MADYWKSIPRKFCEFCKCWLTDNKPSIEFHERGRRHQENVNRKLSELRKKGTKEFKAQVKMNMQMAKINEAAMRSFQKDMVRDPTLVSQLHSTSSFSDTLHTSFDQIPTSSNDKQTSELVFGKSKSKTKKSKSWMESKDELGRKYYWNSETGDSKWEPPVEGYISIFEQNMQQQQSIPKPVNVTSSRDATAAATSTDDEPSTNIKSETKGKWVSIDVSSTTQGTAATSTTDLEEEEEEEPSQSDENVRVESEMYTQWVPVTIKEEEQPQEQVDLQLPERSEYMADSTEAVADTNEVKFKEKLMPVCNESRNGQVTFKKRKMGDTKRNVRRRLDD